MTRTFQQYFKFLFYFFLFNWYQIASAQANFHPDSLHTTLDSLPGMPNVDSAKRIVSKADSVPKQHKKMDSVHFALEAKIDSLKSLNLPYEIYTQKLDSLHLKYSQKVNAKLRTGLQEGENKVNKLGEKIEKKVGKNKGLTRIDLPSPKIPRIDAPDAVTNVDLPGTLDIDAGTTGEIGKLTNASPLDDTMSKIDKAQGFPDEKIDNLHPPGSVKEVTQGLEDVKEYTNQAEAYEEGWAKLKKGNLEGIEKRAEKEAIKNFDEIGELQQHSEGMKQGLVQQTEQEQYQAYIKQQMKQNALSRVSKEFSGNSEKIIQAQKKLANYKKRYHKLEGIKSNPLKDKPFAERLLIGLHLEVLRNKATSLDFAPGAGYKITRQLTIHGGYMYRFLFDNEEKSFRWQDPTYGPRLSASYMIYKGFFAKASFERLRTNIPRNTVPVETTRKWTNSGFIGVGKAYGIASLLKGNLQVLYNFLHSENSPYPNKINIRLGFNFGFKKKTNQ